MTDQSAPTEDLQLRLVHRFKAPPERVFAAWTEPRHVSQWWGPHGFRVPVCEMDVREGGTWRIHMQGPDGAIYPSKGVYQEIVPPRRLVTTDGFDWEPKPAEDMVWTVSFEPDAQGTKLSITVLCQTSEDRKTISEMGWREGTEQMMERLEAYLPRL